MSNTEENFGQNYMPIDLRIRCRVILNINYSFKDESPDAMINQPANLVSEPVLATDIKEFTINNFSFQYWMTHKNEISDMLRFIDPIYNWIDKATVAAEKIDPKYVSGFMKSEEDVRSEWKLLNDNHYGKFLGSHVDVTPDFTTTIIFTPKVEILSEAINQFVINTGISHKKFFDTLFNKDHEETVDAETAPVEEPIEFKPFKAFMYLNK